MVVIFKLSIQPYGNTVFLFNTGNKRGFDPALKHMGSFKYVSGPIDIRETAPEVKVNTCV